MKQRSFGVRLGAISIVAFAAWVGPAGAQLYDDARHSLDLIPDPIARSPRLLGMGRLTYVLDDPRNRITMWDFAGNPTGVMEDDSTSTLEMMPATSAVSAFHDVEDAEEVGRFRERQNLAARDANIGYEAWHRTKDGATYGAIGDLGLLRTDRPIDPDLEQRSTYTVPRIMPVINGHMPFILSDRMLYALRLVYGYQSSNDRLRDITRNAIGDYVDRDGTIVPTRDLFTPNEYSVRTLGGGGALSYRFGDPLTLAIGVDEVGSLIKGKNEGARNEAETRENRPYGSAQLSGVGRIGKAFEWGADARGWRATSKANWLFTTSAGSGSNPLAGRGSLYRRKEEGSSVRGRLRWMLGPFEIGAGGGASRQKVDIDAPVATDTSSFNYFRNVVFFIPAADTLALPDSVSSDEIERRAWDMGGGIGWTRSDRRLTAGAEFHRLQDLFEGRQNGDGPKRVGWDARVGAEYAVGSALRVRGGYIHRWTDQDDFTSQNEYLANGATAGLGISPAGARWSIDTGYFYEWERADFGDPGSPRSNRQQLSMRIYWPL